MHHYHTIHVFDGEIYALEFKLFIVKHRIECEVQFHIHFATYL